MVRAISGVRPLNPENERITTAVAGGAPHPDNRPFAAREVQVADSLSPYMAVVAEYSRGEMNTDEMARKIESVRLKLLRPAADLVR